MSGLHPLYHLSFRCLISDEDKVKSLGIVSSSCVRCLLCLGLQAIACVSSRRSLLAWPSDFLSSCHHERHPSATVTMERMKRDGVHDLWERSVLILRVWFIKWQALYLWGKDPLHLSNGFNPPSPNRGGFLEFLLLWRDTMIMATLRKKIFNWDWLTISEA